MMRKLFAPVIRWERLRASGAASIFLRNARSVKTSIESPMWVDAVEKVVFSELGGSSEAGIIV